MNYKRVVSGATLCLEYIGAGNGVKSICGKTVYCFCRNGDKTAFFNNFRSGFNRALFFSVKK